MAPVLHVETVDLSLYSDAKSLAEAIKPALSSYGFLYLRNTGLEERSLRMFDVAERFFKTETDVEKDKVAMTNNRGYTYHEEVLDPAEDRVDLKEGFNVGFVGGDPVQTVQRLPPTIAQDLDFVAEFQRDCFDCCQRLLRAFAVIFSLDEAFFASQHQHSTATNSTLRLLRYPAIPADADVSPNRAGSHSDYGSLTLLFIRPGEGPEGLQILPPGERVEEKNWRPVGVVDDAVLVNVGDVMEAWVGCTLKSTLHRVRLPDPLPPQGVPERMSIAYFCQPDEDAKVKSVVPLSDITDVDLERMKRKGVKPGVEVTAGEHLKMRLDSTYTFRRGEGTNKVAAPAA